MLAAAHLRASVIEAYSTLTSKPLARACPHHARRRARLRLQPFIASAQSSSLANATFSAGVHRWSPARSKARRECLMLRRVISAALMMISRAGLIRRHGGDMPGAFAARLHAHSRCELSREDDASISSTTRARLSRHLTGKISATTRTPSSK
jgi:hypothetical protein